MVALSVIASRGRTPADSAIRVLTGPKCWPLAELLTAIPDVGADDDFKRV